MTFDPNNAENNEDIERHWAIKAFQHAETYFNMISNIPSEKMKLTPIDKELYKSFRTEFPDMNLMKIDEVKDFKSEEAKSKWRKFISIYENDIEDFNFGTLLRNRANEDYGPDNAFFVTRIQFLCVEVARNFEKLNSAVFQNPKIASEKESVNTEELDAELAELQAKIVQHLK
jgi:predicted transposase YbfD/YdcC